MILFLKKKTKQDILFWLIQVIPMCSVVYFYVHQVKSSAMFLPLRVPYVEKSIHYEHIYCFIELPI